MRFQSALAGLGAIAAGAFLSFSAPAYAVTLHGYCSSGCIDNGTNSPTGANPPHNFGFTASPGPATGTLMLDILVPNNESAPASFGITGTLSGTATLFSATAWTSGQLDSYLGISASPANPIGAFLPSTQALDAGATGFFVYQAILGTATLQGAGNPNQSPLENLVGSLPLASYIVAFLNTGTADRPDWGATANSGAIFETASVVPLPGALPLFATGLGALGLLSWRRKKKLAI